MGDTKLDPTEEAIIASEVSDDALETAAGTGKKCGQPYVFLLHCLRSLPGSLASVKERTSRVLALQGSNT